MPPAPGGRRGAGVRAVHASRHAGALNRGASIPLPLFASDASNRRRVASVGERLHLYFLRARRDVLDPGGRFDRDSFMRRPEDFDLWPRLCEAGTGLGEVDGGLLDDRVRARRPGTYGEAGSLARARLAFLYYTLGARETSHHLRKNAGNSVHV